MNVVNPRIAAEVGGSAKSYNSWCITKKYHKGNKNRCTIPYGNENRCSIPCGSRTGVVFPHGLRTSALNENRVRRLARRDAPAVPPCASRRPMLRVHYLRCLVFTLVTLFARIVTNSWTNCYVPLSLCITKHYSLR